MCFALLGASWYAVAGPKVQPSQWLVTVDQERMANAPAVEAESWLNGRLDLPHTGPDPLHHRMHDTAYVRETGKVYAVNPPLMTMVFAAVGAWDRWVLGVPSGVIGPWVLFGVIVLPLLWASYWAFTRQTGSPEWGAVLALMLATTTANYPLMVESRNGNAGFVNHLLSQTGMMLMAGGALGGRWGVAALGTPIAAWSRQLTIVYVLPVLWLAWRQGRRREFAAVLATAVLAAGAQMGLNWAKFGAPWESGYRLIYEGREDELALRSREGLFAAKWIPDNLWYMVCALPEAAVTNLGPQVTGSAAGNSLFVTTPAAALALLGAWRMRREGARAAFMAASALVMAGVLTYHAPGIISPGCYRFGMDYLPVWLIVAAPVLARPKWRVRLLCCAAWSAVYFQMATQYEGI